MDKDVKRTLEGLLAQITTQVLVQTQTAPLDRVKILLQTQDDIPSIGAGKYLGVRDCMRKIRHEEGLICFWRGNLAGILRASLRFTTTFTLSSYFLSQGTTSTLNALVDIIGMWVSYPLHVARIRLAADVRGDFGGIEDCLLSITKKDGYSGIYTGFGLSVLHSFIKTISLKYLNRFMNYLINKITRDESLRLILKYVFRPVVNITALAIAYPLDVIKNILILQVGRTDAVPMRPLECVRDLILTEGVKGLYKGIIAEILLTYIASLPFEELESSLRDQIWRLLRKYF